MKNAPQHGFQRIARFVELFAARRILAMGMVLLVSAEASSAQSVWPKIALPKDVSAFDIGRGPMAVNGMPMRMQGFVSKTRTAQLAEWFRQSMGRPVAETLLARKLILGKAQGEYYLTVQLEPAGSGTRGLIAITHLKGAYENQAETEAATERWLSRLPAGSLLLSRIESEDAGKIAGHLVIVNNHGEDLNRDRLTALMHEDGLELEREAASNAGTAVQPSVAMDNRKTLFFKGRDKEAMAVIAKDATGRTAIVLNTITSMERFK